MAIEDSGLGVEFNSSDEFFNFILNDLFLPALADTVITPNTLLERLPRDHERVEGKNVVFPIHTDRNLGVNSIAPGGQLPDPGKQGYNQYSFAVAHTYGRIKFDGVSADASRTQMASWLKAVESEVRGLGLDLSRYKQRAYNNDGSGILARSAGNEAGATTTIDLIANPHVEHSGLTAMPDFNPTKFLRVGMVIGLVAATAAGTTLVGALRAVATIDAITDSDTIGVTLVADMNADATQIYIVLASSLDLATGATATASAAADTAYLNDPMGIAGILSDANPLTGDFQGIDATDAANNWHRATILQAPTVPGTPEPLTLPIMDKAFTDAMEIGDAAPTVVFGSFGMARAYAALLLGQRRYVGTTNYDGGYGALEYNGVPLIADRDSYGNRLAFMHEPDLRVYVMTEPNWMSKDGSIYHRIPNRDAYQATLYCRETLGSDVRDKHVLQTEMLEG